ncbi:MAG: RtcB family protein [Candidatus Dadabacteria bacterium]|nr:MAG: RtcB family protein [Candidatus Dadabacteria bacterium]
MTAISDFKEITPYLWEIPSSYRKDMRVPARVYLSREMLETLLSEKSIEQLINVATLPGIDGYALAMPDIHQGYGFPIGGVAAIRESDGVISPGGVGYDINCGVRLLTSDYEHGELKKHIPDLATQMQREVPSGVGRGGYYPLKPKELDQVLNNGVRWALKRGLAFEEDLEAIEEHGLYSFADSKAVSDRAKKRGADQLGTIGAGNHFVELQVVETIYDQKLAEAFGLYPEQLAVMIHTGSRGLGHQTCTDYVKLMSQKMHTYGFTLPDRELCCAPFKSEEGQRYFAAMAAAANFAWTNRQVITHQIRLAWQQVLKTNKALNLKVLFDVSHNIAKRESYNGKSYIVHRKGSTRAFGPGRSELPERYRKTGQPVLIPGSMGTYSYVLAGTERAMQESFGSSCHGAGRQLSRTRAKKTIDYNRLRKELDDYGVEVRAGSAKGLLEEAPQAYKDIDQVISVIRDSGLAKVVARLRPVAVIKG